jgi:hypothetical protein
MLDFDKVQQYIQSENPVDMPKKSQETNAGIPAEVLEVLEPEDEPYDILPEDLEMLSRPLGNLNEVRTHVPPTVQPSNYSIIEKALSKREIPAVDASVMWIKFPAQEIKMLMDLMDVSLDEITDWYIKQVDVAKLTTTIQEAIKRHIDLEFKRPQEENNVDLEDGGALAKPAKEEKPKAKKATASKSKTTKTTKK